MRNDNTLLGIALMLGSVVLFMVLNALVKDLGDVYPVNQITFFRNLFALVPVTLVLARSGGVSALKTQRPFGHFWRSLLGGSTMFLNFWSYMLLPLAKAVALNFAAPLMTVALSVPLLGEKVGIHRWGAVILGFVGVMVMVKPEGDVMLFGSVVALTGAFLQAFAMTTVRQLSRTEKTITIVFYFTFLTTIGSGATLFFSWEPIRAWSDWALFAACGLSGGFAQILMTESYARAPAGVVSPFNYMQIVFASATGWIVWGEIPTQPILIGSGLVVASGLYILYRETVVRRLPPKSEATFSD